MIGSIGEGFVGVGVDFGKNGIDANGEGCAHEVRNHVAVATSDAALTTRFLYAMSGIEYDWDSELTHFDQTGHIDNEIVVAE